MSARREGSRAGMLLAGLVAAGFLAAGLNALPLASTVRAGEPPHFDLDKGQYLTPEEYKKLSKDEALEYCQKLAQEIDIENDNAAAANSQMADIDAEIKALQAQLAEAQGSSGTLEASVTELEAKLKELQELPRTYNVVKDDWLIKISKKERIYKDGHQWGRIYRANKDKIKNPNLIYPGQILVIPR